MNTTDNEQTVPFWFPVGGDYVEELHGGDLDLKGVAGAPGVRADHTVSLRSHLDQGVNPQLADSRLGHAWTRDTHIALATALQQKVLVRRSADKRVPLGQRRFADGVADKASFL